MQGKWRCLEIQVRTVLECCKQSLVGHSDGVVKTGHKQTVDNQLLSSQRKVSAVYEVGMGIWLHSTHFLRT